MSPEVRVLIIDDEQVIRNSLKLILKSQGYVVEEAATGLAGVKAVRNFHPHIVFLDLGLPDMTGLEVLRDIRSWTQVTVIVLTATDDEEMKVKVLDHGADDYLTKPFSSQELLARVRVGLRHSNFTEASTVFTSEDLTVDLNHRRIEVAGQLVKLTQTEFEVLARLVRDNGKVVTQEKIMREVWGGLAAEDTHYLRIYIKQLRKKIEKNPSEPKHILTEPGVGYRLV